MAQAAFQADAFQLDAFQASETAVAPGSTLTVTATLLPGSAGVAATAPGVTLQANAVLIPGTATGKASAAGATITATATLLPGSAGVAATAPGVTLQASASLATIGTARAAAVAPGAIITAQASLIAGSADRIRVIPPGGGDSTGSKPEWWRSPPKKRQKPTDKTERAPEKAPFVIPDDPAAREAARIQDQALIGGFIADLNAAIEAQNEADRRRAIERDDEEALALLLL